MEKELFCADWKFYDGKNTKMVCLPHDAMQETGRSKDAPSGRSEAYFLGGNYEYEKKFIAPKEWREKTVYIEFEGVYPNAIVYLNDKEIGRCNYGYSTFHVKLSNLKYNELNALKVFVDDENHPNSRWYGGAGIYRPVHIVTMPKEHIEINGVKVTTISYNPAKVRVDVECSSKNIPIRIEIMSGTEMVARADGVSCEINIPNAKLWDVDSPYLYTCRATYGEDIVETKFGIRMIEYSMQGLFINGKSTLLKGGCIHHDHGILGARTYDSSEYRRIKRLKEFGFNAIRSAHNPLSRAALEACDELGMYVMDEAFDTWTNTKSPYDHGRIFMENYEEDLKSMIAKDYNHPSVIMYSIGNEVTEPVKKEGVELGRKLVQSVKKLDSTRPVTAGINLTLLFLASLKNNPFDGAESKQEEKTKKMDSTQYNKMVTKNGNSMTKVAGNPFVAFKAAPIFDELDICGYNYATSRYKKDRKKRIIVGSETYCYEIGRIWPMVEKYPHLIGDFMWTAWDYIGEVGIGAWSYANGDDGFEKKYPWLLADSGALDILGNDNAEAGLAAIAWDARKKPYIGVTPANHPDTVPIRAIWRGSNAIPYWSWCECDGNAVDVEVYSKAPKVEVFINGQSIGRKTTNNCKAVFQTCYESGEIKALAYEADGTVSGSILLSSIGETQISVKQEERYANDNIVYIDIDLVGENGVIECNRDTKLTVSVEGGELLAYGSANPCTEESFLEGKYTTYYGKAQAVVRANRPDFEVTVEGEGLRKVKQKFA